MMYQEKLKTDWIKSDEYVNTKVKLSPDLIRIDQLLTSLLYDYHSLTFGSLDPPAVTGSGRFSFPF